MKDRKMSIRISEKDLQKIRQKAKQSGLTFTDYVTRTCLKKKIIVIDGLRFIAECRAVPRNSTTPSQPKSAIIHNT